MPQSILIVDDHELTHSGLRLLLQDYERFQIIGNLKSANKVTAFLDETTVDVLILDLNLPDVNGVSLLAELSENYQLSIIVLTGETKPHDFVYALKMGVDGIISKSDPSRAILTALDKAGDGNTFLSATIRKQIGKLKTPEVQLSPRQIAVLYLLNEGETNKEIAYRLNIAPNTVTFHINEIRKKLDVLSNQQIIARAKELGLI